LLKISVLKTKAFQKSAPLTTQWSQGTKARHAQSLGGEEEKSDDESSLRLFTDDDDDSDCSLQAQQQAGCGWVCD
jgi:hypothetical protein